MNPKNSRLGSFNPPGYSTDGFARLGWSPAIVGGTTNATANGSTERGDLRLRRDGILKTQSMKLRYNDLESITVK